MKLLLFAAAGLIAVDAGAAWPESADRPACRSIELRPLEFWLIGRDAGAAQAGVRERRRLRAVLDGCAISEHWNGAADLPAGGGDRRDAGVRRAAPAALQRRAATARTATVPP